MGFEVNITLFVFTLGAFANVISSTSPSSEKLQLGELRQQLNHLQLNFELKFNQLKISIEKEKIFRQNLETETQELSDKVNSLESSYSGPSAKVGIASYSDNIVPEEVIASPRNLAPTSCLDLQRIGHFLDGIYMVANKEKTKIEAYFCDFGTTLVSQLIGHVDVKSGERTAHFYAQALPVPGIVRFERPTLNEGDAFDPLQGIFTAPVNGTYYFAFNFVQEEVPDPLIIKLQMNNRDVGQATSNIALTEFFFNTFTISMSASLYMVAGDTVNLLATGIIHPGPNNHFTGWLVEEDIIIQ